MQQSHRGSAPADTSIEPEGSATSFRAAAVFKWPAIYSRQNQLARNLANDEQHDIYSDRANKTNSNLTGPG